MSFIHKLWKRTTSGEVVEVRESDYNGRITVKKDLIGYRFLAGGLTQSGGQVKVIWKKGLSALKKHRPAFMPSNILFLGLGAGTGLVSVGDHWPEAEVTGVEIDPIVVEIGKKYFGLDQHRRLSVILEDAFGYLSERAKSDPESEDLILVDLYQGKNYPARGESDAFIKDLVRVLRPDGTVIVNRLYYDEFKQKTEDFSLRLEDYFEKLDFERVGGNLLIYSSNLVPGTR